MSTQPFTAIPLDPKPSLQDFGFFSGERSRMLARLQEISQTYGEIVRLKSFLGTLLVVSSPELVREVLVTNAKSFHKSEAVKATGRLLGNGLLTSEGEFHLRQRRLVQPAFHRQRLADLGGMMVSYAQRHFSQFESHTVVDMHHEFTILTMHIVAKALFNADVGASEKIGHAIDFLIQDLMVVDGTPFGKAYRLLPTQRNRKSNTNIRYLRGAVGEFIRAGRARQQDLGDLLSILLESQDIEGDGNGMSDEQITDEVTTLFVAGHETTANWLSWTSYILSQQPQIQQKLRAEVQAVIGERTPTVEDIPNLPYCRNVLSETLRLYPPAFALGRKTITDTELGGYRIPARTPVLISPWVVQRDARYWEQPDEFIPERWENPAVLRQKFSFFPFGAGVRACIGEGFAWQEATLVLASLLQNWELRYAGEHPILPSAQLTLRPGGKVAVEIRPLVSAK